MLPTMYSLCVCIIGGDICEFIKCVVLMTNSRNVILKKNERVITMRLSLSFEFE